MTFCWKLFWTHWYTCMSQAHCTFPSRNAVQISLGPNAQWNGSRFARGFTRFHCPFSFFHMFKVLRIILQFYKLGNKMYHFSYWITTKGVCFLLDMLTWMVIANKALLTCICLANNQIVEWNLNFCHTSNLVETKTSNSMDNVFPIAIDILLIELTYLFCFSRHGGITKAS